MVMVMVIAVIAVVVVLVLVLVWMMGRWWTGMIGTVYQVFAM
jgi:hypothetical protein